MPTLSLYHLSPAVGRTFRLGQRGIEQEETGLHLPSDTLFAALLIALLESGVDPGHLVENFPRLALDDTPLAAVGPLPFLLTSAFPRAGQVRFYPALPLGLMLSQAQIDALHRANRLKELKRIKFISEGLFNQIVAGHYLDDRLPAQNEPQPTDRGLYVQNGVLWLAAEEIERLPESIKKSERQANLYQALRRRAVFRVNKTPRVTVDRQRNSSAIYHTGRLIFNQNCGLWFGLAWARDAAPEVRQWVSTALTLLADEGLGGERSAGYGHFTINAPEPDSVTYTDPADGDLFITLSRYHPTPAELPHALADPRTQYTLTSVSGWLWSPQASAQRRRRLWLAAEGSALRAVGGGPWGDVVDVRPVYGQAGFPHPVWRYGLACPVSLKKHPAQEANYVV